jgi:hypothetical protein
MPLRTIEALREMTAKFEDQQKGNEMRFFGIAAAALCVTFSGCTAVSSGIAGMTGNLMSKMLGKPIEVSDSVKEVATIDNSDWLMPEIGILAYAFRFSVPQDCKRIEFSGKAYLGQTIVGQFTSGGTAGEPATPGTINVPANTKVHVSNHLRPTGRGVANRLVLDSFKCVNS